LILEKYRKKQRKHVKYIKKQKLDLKTIKQFSFDYYESLLFLCSILCDMEKNLSFPLYTFSDLVFFFGKDLLFLVKEKKMISFKRCKKCPP